MNRNSRLQDTVSLIINLFLIWLITLIFRYYWYKDYHNLVYFYQIGNVFILILYYFCLYLFNKIYGGFNLGVSGVTDLLLSQTITVVLTNMVIYILSSFVYKGVIKIRGFLWIIFLEIIAFFVLDLLINRLYYHLFSPKSTLLVYEGDYRRIYEKLVRYQNRSIKITDEISIGDFNMSQYQQSFPYECVIIIGLSDKDKKMVSNFCYLNSISLYEIPTLFDVILQNSTYIHLIDTPVFKMNRFGPDQVEKFIKRVFDIVFSAVLIVITSPIWLITAIAIKAYDGGPVFYCQKRLTQYGKIFKIIKFRSMKIDAEKNGAQFAKENDDRITPVGKFIRSCRIDEFPQLLNILAGDMSVVGPRPERPEIVEQIKSELPEFDFRLKVKAGLTGFAQVYGKYNTDLKDKLLLDMMYIENYSIMLDLRIILMTIKTVFVKDSTEGV